MRSGAGRRPATPYGGQRPLPRHDRPRALPGGRVRLGRLPGRARPTAASAARHPPGCRGRQDWLTLLGAPTMAARASSARSAHRERQPPTAEIALVRAEAMRLLRARWRRPDIASPTAGWGRGGEQRMSGRAQRLPSARGELDRSVRSRSRGPELMARTQSRCAPSGRAPARGYGRRPPDGTSRAAGSPHCTAALPGRSGG